MPYKAALERQQVLADERARGVGTDRICAVEHPPTVTLGLNAPAEDILLDRAELARRGVEIVRADRGGRATYHGPGQAIVYPIVKIDELGLGARRWVSVLEDALRSVLQDFGVQARCRAGNPGLWVQNAKIASIGLRVRRGVSYHGVSLNVGLDVSGFDCIVTCGVAGQSVTSIAAQTSSAPDVFDVRARISRAIHDRIT